jgi:general secretion pathway protein K
MVLLLLALVSVMVLGFAQEWRLELLVARNQLSARQAALLAEGGVYYALGKLIQAQQAERRAPQAALGEPPEELWRGDGTVRELALPGGRVVVRVTDESGKINLNQAPEVLLLRLFEVLGVEGPAAEALVDALADWRDPDSIPRPRGAESDYYARLTPPYPAKNGPLDLVEELFWIKGFDAGRLLRLRELVTVQKTGRGINLNAAPPEVLRALGFSAEQALTIVQARQTAPLRNRRELDQLFVGLSTLRLPLPLTFRSSQIFEIVSTGVIDYPQGAQHTIRAVVRLTITRPRPWEFLLWNDDYLG